MTLANDLVNAYHHAKKVAVITGAGVSAESGILTFRDNGGYWTKNPMEIATKPYFLEHPEETWQWYLERRKICRNAEPNLAHNLIVEMDKRAVGAFTLVTQNVDGLHIRAGNSIDKTIEIHGNLHKMRCIHDPTCANEILSIPENATIASLKCAKCGDWMRPHVLWFNEAYCNQYYNIDAAEQAIGLADVCLVIGTSGSVGKIPSLIRFAWINNAYIAEINPNQSVITQYANIHIKERATEGMRRLFDAIYGI